MFSQRQTPYFFMSADSKLGFNETVELLSNQLPARALSWLTEETGEVDGETLQSNGITDQSIAMLLDEGGIHRYQITRAAVDAVLSAKQTPRTSPDIFSVVDPELRQDQNPFIEQIRTLLKKRLES
tara:strand:- start:1569 stop:1946 length:378 start_codon:yes stop_codon:yes gene_type:complete